MKTIENQFDEDMKNIYIKVKKEIGYNATRFLQLLSKKGGVATARQLISKDEGTYGFEILWEKHRLDLSVENLMIQEKYRCLFSDEENEIYKKRLREYGFEID